MSGVRRSLAMASVEQYLSLSINFIMIAAMSRLLTPAEVGLAVVSSGLQMIVFSVREFVTTEFLIQQQVVRESDIRTSFTMVFATSLVLALALFIAAPTLAHIYGNEKLSLFLTIALFGALVEAFASPAIALLRRDMAFGTIALIRSIGVLATAITSIGFAWSGFGFVSVAIGGLIGSCITSALAITSRAAPWMFRPSLASWREVYEFGRYKGATMIINRVYESLPQLVLARLLPMASVGLYNRANTVCTIPDRVLLSSVFAVAYPALSASLRGGQDMKKAYLKALAHISVVYWPAQLLLAILADPVVHIVLGPNWAMIVPLVQIISVASVCWFPVMLTYPVLAAIGANRDAFVSQAIGRSVAAIMLCSASPFGLTALAFSQWVNLPFQMFVALSFVRKHINFSWRELAAALMPSSVATITSLVGPLSLVATNGFRFDFSIGFGLAAIILAGGGWLAGLAISGHPMLAEVNRFASAAARSLGARRPGRRAAPVADLTTSGTP